MSIDHSPMKTFQDHLRAQLAAALEAEADALVEKALEGIRQKLRESLAQKVLSLVRTDYSIERDGYTILIRVQLNGSK